MNVKGKTAKRQAPINETENNVINMLSEKEMINRAETIRKKLTAWTWKDLETHGKFDINKKLSFITDDMLIVGCDIGSETHYVRAIDIRGRELSKEAYSFSNSKEGFESVREWALKLAAEHEKTQIVLGLEPTGHYRFCIAEWMITNGTSVVQVNPYAVKQMKELEDNSQAKDDRKDSKLIANLVKDGNFGMPYLPEDVYADLRGFSLLRNQLTEDRIRNTNRLHRQMKIYFPEYMDAFGKIEGEFAMAVLLKAPFPEDIVEIGTEGMRAIWHEAKLRGRGYSRAAKIVSCAETNVGLGAGTDAARMAARWYVQNIMDLNMQLELVETQLHQNATRSRTRRTSLRSEASARIFSQVSWRKWGISAGSMM